MLKSLASLAVAAAVLALFIPTVRADDEADKKVREAATEFMNALKSESVEGVMKVADVPFYEDGHQVIAERDGVEKLVRELFEKEDDLGSIKFEITKIHAIENVREKFSEPKRELLKGVMADGDRVVQFKVEHDGQTEDGFLVLVRVREGMAKVVGVED